MPLRSSEVKAVIPARSGTLPVSVFPFKFKVCICELESKVKDASAPVIPMLGSERVRKNVSAAWAVPNLTAVAPVSVVDHARAVA